MQIKKATSADVAWINFFWAFGIFLASPAGDATKGPQGKDHQNSQRSYKFKLKEKSVSCRGLSWVHTPRNSLQLLQAQ